MKHIKLFENYNGSNYIEINKRDFEKYILGEDVVCEPFTRGEVKDIELTNPGVPCKLERHILQNGKVYDRCAIYMGVDEEVLILKLKDEWYMVYAANNRSYRCDQFDGLLECLKDV